MRHSRTVASSKILNKRLPALRGPIGKLPSANRAVKAVRTTAAVRHSAGKFNLIQLLTLTTHHKSFKGRSARKTSPPFRYYRRNYRGMRNATITKHAILVRIAERVNLILCRN